MDDVIFSPSDFVAALNQTLDFAYPIVVIEGELANFRVSKNRWVYFDLKDQESSVSFFGTIYQLPGPLQDGLTIRAVGSPRLHPRFGFTVNFQSLIAVGEGSIKKAADLLFKKLEAEGLFDLQRKRLLPELPQQVALISAAGSAAAADFIKILNERWGGVEIFFADTYVQGEQAPAQLVAAIEYFNKLSSLPEVLVITRGGGSAEDLAAFNDERVVRAVAASRIPTLVAIGHEVDISMAELAADRRASTPSNAAQILVPDRKAEIANLQGVKQVLLQKLSSYVSSEKQALQSQQIYINKHIEDLIYRKKQNIDLQKRAIALFNPKEALRRGYALARKQGKHISSVSKLKPNDAISVELADGTIDTKVQKVITNGKSSKII